MRRIFVVLLLFFITVGAAWSQFYTNLSQDQRKELAEAYYLAGQQYKRVNKTEKGNEFISMAYRIYPGLHSETIEPAELPEPAVPLSSANGIRNTIPFRRA